MTAAPGPMGKLAARLREAGGGTVAAVLAYGSRLVAASPDRHSAYDLVVVVDNYRGFYRALRSSGHAARSVALLAAVSRVLPPTVIAFRPGPPGGPLAKCAVVSRDHFERELGPRRLDHFCLGRMTQRIAVVHVRDEATAAWVRSVVAGARDLVPDLTLPFLYGPFTVDRFCRRMLEVSYGGELRPERRGRASTVYEAQREALRGLYAPVLEAGVASGLLGRADGGYVAARSPSRLARLRWRAYFGLSKTRATARWLKHMLTFDGWFPYIVRKTERRTGMTVEITPLERRFPVPLLLPKVLRVLRTKGEAGGGSPRAGKGPAR